MSVMKLNNNCERLWLEENGTRNKRISDRNGECCQLCGAWSGEGEHECGGKRDDGQTWVCVIVFNVPSPSSHGRQVQVPQLVRVHHNYIVEFGALAAFWDFSPTSDLDVSFDPLFSSFHTLIDFLTWRKNCFHDVSLHTATATAVVNIFGTFIDVLVGGCVFIVIVSRRKLFKMSNSSTEISDEHVSIHKAVMKWTSGSHFDWVDGLHVYIKIHPVVPLIRGPSNTWPTIWH